MPVWNEEFGKSDEEGREDRKDRSASIGAKM